MRAWTTLICVAAGATFLIVPAAAQTVSIVTTPAGSFTNSVGAAIAKAVADKSNLHMTVRPQATIGFDEVASGGAEFNVSNTFDVTFYATGTGDYAGKGAKPNIRVVGALLPFRVALHVRADSPIKSIADLKSRRVPAGFNAQKTAGRIVAALLANGGLSYDDVGKVLAPNIARATQDFIGNKVDVAYFALGSGTGKQAAASVGGVRVLPLNHASDAMQRLRAMLPGAYALRVKPRPNLEGISEPTDVLAFDLVLNTAAAVPDDVVYKVTKALYESQKMLAATFAPLRLFVPQKMPKRIEHVPLHPGAVKFYREVGLVPKA